MSHQSSSQTVGPFFHFSLVHAGDEILVNDQTSGQHIVIFGFLLDGDGAGVPDALIETWQADAGGIYNHPADPRRTEADPHFNGFGRAATDKEGRFEIRTVKPGMTAGPEGRQAPHINLRVFARGMLVHAFTRLYFPDEPSNRDDPVLNMEGVADRKATLISVLEEGPGLPAYRFDVHLQGERETVFFNPAL